MLALFLLACGSDADADGVRSPLDCNDGDPAVHPGAAEACDDVDSDCDQLTDDDDPDAARGAFYADLDGDGYGRAAGVYAACTAPAGYVTDATDCDDARPDVYPGATDVCDGHDGDCDGVADDEETDLALIPWYLDADRDGHGDPATAVLGCTPPDEHVADATDCDDGDNAIYPGAEDVCGGDDADCDGADDACVREGALGTADADAWLIGEAAGDRAGTAVATADVDGDGVVDVLSAAPRAENTAGAASVVLGPFVGTRSLAEASLRVAGEDDDAPLEVVAGGDLDADGLAELIVAAPRAAAIWVFGAARRGDLAVSDADATGTDDDASFAGAALLVADLAGDGGADLIVGATHGTGSDGADRGVTSVYAGPLVGGWSAVDAWLTLEGVTSAAKAGAALAAADIDGDGVVDLILGAPGDGTAATLAGAVYVLAGPLTPGLALADAEAVLLGIAGGDAAGSSVAAVGDIDADGVDDLVIGAPQADGDWTGEGAAYLMRGPYAGAISLAAAHCTLLGESEGELAGHRVVAAGDVNGDARADVWIGGGGLSNGRAWLLEAPFAGTISLEYAEVVVSGSAADNLGPALAGGDVDGDGRADLVVGVPGADGGGSTSGGIALYRGWEAP